MNFVKHNGVTINLGLITSIRTEKLNRKHFIVFMHIPYINQSPIESQWSFDTAEERDRIYEELNKKLQVEEIY